MVVVNKSQVTLSGNKLIGEASTFGLGVGEWPDFISVVDDGGSGFLFQRGSRIVHGGEVAGMTYWTKAGIELTVFND